MYQDYAAWSKVPRTIGTEKSAVGALLHLDQQRAFRTRGSWFTVVRKSSHTLSACPIFMVLLLLSHYSKMNSFSNDPLASKREDPLGP